MADAVDVDIIKNNENWLVVHLTSNSDGTGESAVNKVDISTFLRGGLPLTGSAVWSITGSVWGGDVTLAWDHTTDDIIAIMSGTVNIDWSWEGGKVDPRSAGGTGDILLTTSGFAATSGYDLTLRIKKKN